MTELTASAERLAQAVERLEQAARRRNAGEPAEFKRLGAELAHARSARAQLETVTEGASLRLDAAIDRLRAALGE